MFKNIVNYSSPALEDSSELPVWEYQMDYSLLDETSSSLALPASHAEEEKEENEEEEEEALTVKLPSSEEIAGLGQLVRWKHLSVVLNNISFRMPRSRLIQLFNNFGPLRLAHMPHHLPHRQESHRGFAVFTYFVAQHTNAALKDGKECMAEAGYHGVHMHRLGNHPRNEKYCEGINVAAVMGGAFKPAKASSPRKNMEPCPADMGQKKADEAIQERYRVALRRRDDLIAYLSLRQKHKVSSSSRPLKREVPADFELEYNSTPAKRARIDPSNESCKPPVICVMKDPHSRDAYQYGVEAVSLKRKMPTSWEYDDLLRPAKRARTTDCLCASIVKGLEMLALC